jgi:hypothetical protein
VEAHPQGQPVAANRDRGHPAVNVLVTSEGRRTSLVRAFVDETHRRGGRVHAGDVDAHVGYRWYDARRQPVLFPFGHGQSYTAFEYRSARTTLAAIAPDEGTTLSVDVTNTGRIAGSEVVQVYVRAPEAAIRRPDKEHRGFAKVYLEPNEMRTVEIPLGARAVACWDARHGGWVTAPGRYEVLVGSSSAAILAMVPHYQPSGRTNQVDVDGHVAAVGLAGGPAWPRRGAWPPP